MPIFSELLKNVSGKATLSININGKEAFDVLVDEKEITVDVKDPFALLEFGLGEIMKKKGKSRTVQKLKDAGFKVKVKYKLFKVEL